ncbi:hypothetical protein MJO28_004371 [Puccinia striiformis f. sp. tritici]|uniref:Uncharacterized protein n=1 Tax=Puccinia striiformis f. sp. tritici TaxID=168172 RepID=A0ACC0EPF1_9BASI|nr:hypothetical protein MJO28_004371 [Puccinia striiformis f. sp. tritici]
MVRAKPNQKPNLSTKTKAMIAGMAQASKSLDFLPKEFQTAKSTLLGIINCWKKTGTNESKKPPANLSQLTSTMSGDSSICLRNIAKTQ